MYHFDFPAGNSKLYDYCIILNYTKIFMEYQNIIEDEKLSF